MHIEKNVFDNIIRTLMNIEGKIKHSLKAHLDLQKMGIRQSLKLKEVNGKIVLLVPCYLLSNVENKHYIEGYNKLSFPMVTQQIYQTV